MVPIPQFPLPGVPALISACPGVSGYWEDVCFAMPAVLWQEFRHPLLLACTMLIAHPLPHPCPLRTQWSAYVWLLVIGSFTSFFAAWGIGANDVANSFATSECCLSAERCWNLASLCQNITPRTPASGLCEACAEGWIQDAGLLFFPCAWF